MKNGQYGECTFPKFNDCLSKISTELKKTFDNLFKPRAKFLCKKRVTTKMVLMRFLLLKILDKETCLEEGPSPP